MEVSSPHAKQKWLIISLCCLLFAVRLAAQTAVSVTYYNGTEQGYPVSASGKLYFENGNLQIISTGGSTPVSIPVSIIRKISFSNSALPLPLRMVDFTVSSEKAVVLSWKTVNEVNTSHFEIERSAAGAAYEKIGQVTSVNSVAGSNYSFSDQHPQTGISYYRLKQVDADGKWEYSKVLTVNRTTSSVITLLPNPAGDYIRINSAATGRSNIKIYSSEGRLVLAGSYTPGEQISVIKLTPGMYTAIINDKTYKFIKR